jgi:hypothetical protein
VVKIKKLFPNRIRGSRTPFFLVSSEKKWEKKFTTGDQSPAAGSTTVMYHFS